MIKQKNQFDEQKAIKLEFVLLKIKDNISDYSDGLFNEGNVFAFEKLEDTLVMILSEKEFVLLG